METINLYNRIYTLCKEKGVSIRSVEAECGMSNGKIKKLIDAQNPSLVTVEKIANYFGVTIDYLIGNTDIKSSASDILKDEDLAFLQRAKESLPAKRGDKMMLVWIHTNLYVPKPIVFMLMFILGVLSILE